MKWWWWAALALCGCGGQGPAAPPVSKTRVAVATCGRQAVSRQVFLPGDVRAYQEAQLHARVSGYLDAVLVDRGDRVVRGQLLARLRLPEAERELAQAQAARSKGQSELVASQARLLRAQADLTTAEADLRRSQAQRQQLAAELTRAQSLERQASSEKALAEANRNRLVSIAAEDSGLVASQELDVSRTSVEVAAQKLQAARGMVASARQSLAAGGEAVASARTRVVANADQVQVARAQVQSSSFQTEADDQAEARMAELLAYTEIRAPFAGIITARFLDPGALVQTSDRTAQQATRPVLALADFERVRVRVEPPQDVATLVNRGTPVQVLDGERSFPSRVARVSGSLDASSRTMVAEIDLPNREHRLRPGMYVKVVLEVARHPNALAVPAAAVVVERDKRSVFVVEGEKARRVRVKVGLENPQWVEIVEGLKGGEEVVVTAPSKLSDGAAVEVQRRGAAE